MNIWTVLKSFLEINYLIDLNFIVLEKTNVLVRRIINILMMFKMNAMGDYHELYLKTDVLLLADIFGKFISTCLEHYGLFPCHYFSSSRLSFDIILKMTKI